MSSVPYLDQPNLGYLSYYAPDAIADAAKAVSSLIPNKYLESGSTISLRPGWTVTHTAFGRGFGIITVLLVLFALVGRLPHRHIVMTAILIPLYVFRILLIELPDRFFFANPLKALETFESGVCRFSNGVGKFGFSTPWWTFDQNGLSHLSRKKNDIERHLIN